jgi:hypothetical protein
MKFLQTFVLALLLWLAAASPALAAKIGDLVQQQSTSTGTGSMTLSAVSDGTRTFNAEWGTGGTDVFYYFIQNESAVEWEVGTGHLSAASTLVRDTVLTSSNANALVNFSAGTKDIVNDLPASLQTQLETLTANLAAKQPLATNLTSWAAYNTNGLLTQTASGTYTGRTITGTSNRLSVTNGSGVSGNPTLDIDSAYVGQATITTLGTIGTGVWNGTAIGDTYISSASTWNAKAASGANTDITSILLNQTGLVIKGATATALTIKPNETLTSGRTLNIITGDATRTLTFAGDATISGTHSGTSSGTNTGDQTTVSGNAGTATALQNARTIGGVSFDGTANIVPQTIQSVNEATDTTTFPLFITTSGSQSLQPLNNSGFTYNSNTNNLTATTFTGALTGNATTATTLATTRSIYGNNFNGSADLAQIIASTYGGTGNGFTKFSGPASTEKTFTLPNASATILTDNALVTAAQGGTANGFTAFSGPASTTKTFTLPNASASILTDNAAVTVAQGGTGLATLTAHNMLIGNGASNITSLAPGTSGNVATSNGTDWTSAAPASPNASWTSLCSGSFPAATTASCTSLAATHRNLVITWTGASSDTATRALEVEVSAGSGFSQTYSSWLSGLRIVGAGSITTALAQRNMFPTDTETAAQVSAGRCTIYDYADANSAAKDYSCEYDSASATNKSWITGTLLVTTAINGVQFFWNASGNFDAGTYAVYGAD